METIPRLSTQAHSYYGGADHAAAVRAELCARIRRGNGIIVFDHTGLESLFAKQFAQEGARVDDVRVLEPNGSCTLNLLSLMGRQGFERFIKQKLPTASDTVYKLAVAIYDRLEAIGSAAKDRPIPLDLAKVVPPFSFKGINIWINRRLEPKQSKRNPYELNYLAEFDKKMGPLKAAQTNDALRALSCDEYQEVTHPLTRAALMHLKRAIEPLASIRAFNTKGPNALQTVFDDSILIIKANQFGSMATRLLFETLVEIGARRKVDNDSYAISIVSTRAQQTISPKSQIAARSLLVRKIELILGDEKRSHHAIGHAELEVECQTLPTPKAAEFYGDTDAPTNPDWLWPEESSPSHSSCGFQHLKAELLAVRNRHYNTKGTAHEPRI